MIARAALVLLLTAQALTLYTAGEVVMRVFPEPHNELVSAPAFILTAWIAFLIPAALDWFAVEGGRRTLAVVILGLLVLYGALRIQYAADLALWDFSWLADFITATGTIREWIPSVLSSAILLGSGWMWATWRANQESPVEVAPGSLAIPFGLVTFALLVSVGSEQGAVVARGGVAFYGVALAALASAQLAQSGSTIGAIRSGGVTTVALTVIAALTALGVILLGLFLEPLVEALAGPAGVVARAIGWFLTWAVVYPLIWVLDHIFEFLQSLLGSPAEPPEPDLPEPPPEAEGAGEGEERGGSRIGEIWRYVAASGALVLGLAILAGLFALVAMFRRRSTRDQGAPPETERAGAFTGDLREAVRGLFRRRPPRPPAEGVARLYFEVLEAARKAGAPRAAGQTPQEFAPILSRTFARQGTDEITAAFESARYAGRPPDEAALADLRRRWEQPP